MSVYYDYLVDFNKALPGVLGNRGKRGIYFRRTGEQRPNFEGTGEQRQYWGTGNIRKQIFDFWGTWEQASLFQGNKGTGTPWEGLFNGLNVYSL